jgi:hypothetical protein
VTRHPFDPVSFVLGALTLAAGIVVLAGRSLVDDADILLPAGLLCLGAALLVRVAGRRDPVEAPAAGEPAGGSPPPPRDADDDDADDPDSAPADPR